MKRVPSLAGFFVACLLSHPAMGQCVSYHYPATSAGYIGVSAGSGWASPPPIGAAIAIWGSCSGMGSDFPEMGQGAGGNINVDVEYRPNESNPFNGGGCAAFDHELDAQNRVTGGTVIIYGRDHNNASCQSTISNDLDKLIAHELGHVLGLANTPCSGYIMGTWWSVTEPHSDECNWIDEHWNQSNEPPDPGPGNGDVEDCQSPLILDLNGDGVRTTSMEDPVWFDLTGDGVAEIVAWTHPFSEEGFLWIDLNGNHHADNGKELFGTGTVLPDGSPAPDGFAALAIYDTVAAGGNEDGEISSADWIWARLRLWVDRNHDGISQRDETGPIHRFGVVSISLKFGLDEHSDENGNFHRYRGTFDRRVHGAILTFAMDDVFFQTAAGPD